MRTRRRLAKRVKQGQVAETLRTARQEIVRRGFAPNETCECLGCAFVQPVGMFHAVWTVADGWHGGLAYPEAVDVLLCAVGLGSEEEHFTCVGDIEGDFMNETEHGLSQAEVLAAYDAAIKIARTLGV